MHVIRGNMALKIDFIDEKMNIDLCDRIDSGNASELGNTILQAISEHPGIKKIVFNADGLVYISSAGLRMLLSAKKKIKDTSIINVSSEVYEILETTGFSQMIETRKKFKTISVEGCPVIGKGACGTVYRTDPETVVKVYHEPDLEKVMNERETAKRAFVLGVPTAISYNIVKVGDSYASVFEMLESDSMCELLAANPDRIDEYIDSFVSTMKQIHEIDAAGEGFPSFKAKMYRFLDEIRDQFTEEECRKIESLIDEVPDSTHLMHGDLHPGNIMCLKGEYLLIDLDRLSMGAPVLEHAMTYISLCGFAEFDPEDSIKFFASPREVIMKFFEESIRRYMGLSTDVEYDDYLRRIRMLGYIKGINSMLISKKLKKDRYRQAFEFWKKELKDMLAE